jgi:hypothetical protein
MPVGGEDCLQSGFCIQGPQLSSEVALRKVLLLFAVQCVIKTYAYFSAEKYAQSSITHLRGRFYDTLNCSIHSPNNRHEHTFELIPRGLTLENNTDTDDGVLKSVA